MNPQNAQRLMQLANQLAEMLMAAAICANEVRTVIRAESDGDGAGTGQRVGSVSATSVIHGTQRPFLDESTLCVIWKGKSVHLGNTRAFWLLERLARRPNQYVKYLDLIREVWGDQRIEDATIRSVVRSLRRRLRASGMEELAIAVRGHNGRYILDLE